MQVGQALDRIGEGLLIDLGVFRPDPVPDGAVGDGGKFETRDATPWLVPQIGPDGAVWRPMPLRAGLISSGTMGLQS